MNKQTILYSFTISEPVSSDSSLDNFISRVIDTAKVAVSKETFESTLKKYISRVIDNARMAVSKEEEEKVKGEQQQLYPGRNVRKRTSGHERQAKVRISLRMRRSDQNLHRMHF